MLWLLQAVAVLLSQLLPPSSTLPSPMSSCRFCLNLAECQYSIQDPQEWQESIIPVYSKWNSYGLIAVDSEWNSIILMGPHGIPIESIPLLQNSRSQVSMKIEEVHNMVKEIHWLSFIVGHSLLSQLAIISCCSLSWSILVVVHCHQSSVIVLLHSDGGSSCW